MNSFDSAGFPFVGFNLPSFSVEALLEVQRKNAVALSNANQAVVDGLKTLAERQGDLLMTTIDDCSKVASDILAGASFEERATKQADATRHIYVSTVARFRDLSDIAVKANACAVDILNARVTEAFDELSALFAAPAARSAAPAETDVAIEVHAEPVPVTAEAEEAAPVADTVSPAEIEAEPAVGAAPAAAPKKARAAKATVTAAAKTGPKTTRSSRGRRHR